MYLSLKHIQMMPMKKNDHETTGPYRKKILLVQPEFPIPNKRKVHHDFFPIGLLKIGTYLKRKRQCRVKLVFQNEEVGFQPDEIWITSLFTYWSKYVRESIEYYKKTYPGAKIFLGGIYATLMADDIKIPDITIQKGVYHPAEEYCKNNNIDESLLSEPLDFQILHSMRGCFRKCEFCGTWKIEPKEEFTAEIHDLINKNHVIFYDNNILRRPDINDFLIKLSEKKVDDKRVTYESQSGFDGRILDQEIANLLKKARFTDVRIAWDGKEGVESLKKQMEYLHNAGYPKKDIYVFMLFNWNLTPREMEEKRVKCWELGVQISDCRYRPLTQLYDNYSTRLDQTDKDYYIHDGWTDKEVKAFRRNIRKHNICVRHGLLFYSSEMERMKIDQQKSMQIRSLVDKDEIRKEVTDAWFPDENHTS